MVVMWPVLTHVMSFDVVVMSFDAMWLLVLCHVTWCNAMSCDVRSCDVPAMVALCSKWFCDDVVIQSTILYYKVLLCTTKHYSSTYNVLLQYYSVLQSTTPVLLCTAKYYSSATLYYKVLLQYYSVLQSTTPVLLCTAKYYSSTTLYYKVLLQYFSVLQSSIHDWSLTHMNRYLHVTKCYACHEKSHSNFTKYSACHAKCISWLIRVTYETSFRMRGASKVNLEPQQILRLPRKMNLMIDPRLIWNVISNAQSKQSQPPTSANTAPATQNESHDWSASHMKRHLECAEQAKSTSNLSKYCACHAKWISWLIRASYETSFPMRRASKVNLQPQQILRLPRKMNPMINPRHTWNVIYNARSMHSQPPTSPNTAPARELLPPIERRFEDNPTMIRG